MSAAPFRLQTYNSGSRTQSFDATFRPGQSYSETG